MRPLILPAATLLTLVAALSSCTVMDPSEDGNLVPRTVDEDPTIPSVELAGTKLHLETFGDSTKPVIIFLHGGPGVDYRDNLRLKDAHDGYALTDDHFVVYWDQRGSGLSRRHDCGVYSLAQVDGDLDALVERVSPGRPVFLVGHSWGGMLATLYIDRHPEKVAGAVLIEPGPLTGKLFEEVKSQLFDFDVFGEVLNDVVWDNQFLTPDDHARADYEMLIGMRDGQSKFHQDRGPDPAPVWRLGAVASRCIQASGMKNGKADYDFTDHLAAYMKPVRFVASANNTAIGVAFQERQRKAYSSTDLVVIANAGHDAPWTHPAEVAAAIHSYLMSVETAAVSR
jgi:proline iminopeptidase